MKKNLWVLAVLILMFAACGGSGSDSGTSTDLTTEEQAAAVDMVMSEWDISNAVNSALGGAAAMVVDAVKEMRAETVSVDCDFGGTISISSAAGTYTATFNNCASTMTTPDGVGISFSIDGNIVITGTTVTYNDLTVHWVCIVGDTEFRTCHMSGSSTGAGDSVTYNLSGYCGATNFTHTGTVSGALINSHFIVNGSAVYTITGSSSGRIVRCTYSDFDVTTATCAEYATACGLSAATACATTCPSS